MKDATPALGRVSSARSTSAPPPSIPSNKRGLRDQLQACDAAGLGASPRAVLAALWTFTDESGGAWPSQRRLAALTGLCERTVRTAVQRLERAALVARDVPTLRDRRRVRRTTAYRVRGLAARPAGAAALVEPSPELRAAGARLAALVEPLALPSPELTPQASPERTDEDQPELTRAPQARAALVAPLVEPVAVAPDNQAPALQVEPVAPAVALQASPELHAPDQRAPAADQLSEASSPAVAAADSDAPELTYSDGPELESVSEASSPASEVLSAPWSPALGALVEPVDEDRPHPPGNARSVEPSPALQAPAAITGNRFRQRDQRKDSEGERARAETAPPAVASPDQSEPAAGLDGALVEPVDEDQPEQPPAVRPRPARPARPAQPSPWSPARTRPPRALRAAAGAPLAPMGPMGHRPPERALVGLQAPPALGAAVARLAALVASPGSGKEREGTRTMDDNGRQRASARPPWSPPCTDRPVSTHPPRWTGLDRPARARAALVAPAPLVEPSPPERTDEDQPELTRAPQAPAVALVEPERAPDQPERTRDTSPDTDTSAPDGSGRDLDSETGAMH